MSTIREDVAALFKEIARPKPIRPAVTVHHPNCKVWQARDLAACNCGGWAFPT